MGVKLRSATANIIKVGDSIPIKCLQDIFIVFSMWIININGAMVTYVLYYLYITIMACIVGGVGDLYFIIPTYVD